MDYDYGTQDTSTFTDNTYDSNSNYNYNNTEQQNVYETHSSNDQSFSKGNDYYTSSEQTNSEQANLGTNIFSPNDNADSTDEGKDVFFSERQDSAFTNETEDSKNPILENLDSENFSSQNNEFLLDVNRDTQNNEKISENQTVDDDSRCCNPIMCLACFCDCFGI